MACRGVALARRLLMSVRMRPTILLLTLSSALAGACTDAPDTSPGRLEKIHDKAFACEDGSSPSWSCSTEVMVDGATIQSVGVHNDGSLNGPASLGTLSETAL